jgi:hypothetical protein
MEMNEKRQAETEIASQRMAARNIHEPRSRTTVSHAHHSEGIKNSGDLVKLVLSIGRT